MAPRGQKSSDLGIGERDTNTNALNPAQSWDAWVTILDTDAETLQRWIRSSLMPKSTVYLAVKHHLGRNTRAPPNNQIVETVYKNVLMCAYDDDRFVKSEEFSILAVWARTVHMVQTELIRKFGLQDQYFPQSRDKTCAALAFLVFINKEMGQGRAFDVTKPRNKSWHNQVLKIVQQNNWDITRAVRKAEGGPPAMSAASNALTGEPLGPAGSATPNLPPTVPGTAHIADGPPPTNVILATSAGLEKNGKRIEARWGTDPSSSMPFARRLANCSLAEFKQWATNTFQLADNHHIICKVFEAVKGDWEDTRLIKDDDEWRKTIANPNTTRDGAPFIAIDIMTKSTAPRNDRPAWMKGPAFADLTLEGTVDHDGRMPAYKLSYHRTYGQALALLDVGIATIQQNMLVNTRKESLKPDFNAESALFPGDDGQEGETELTEKQLLTYEKVQQLLASESLSFNDVAECKRQLQNAIGNHTIVVSLPTRRSLDSTTGLARSGNRHKPHQICFLSWAIYMEWMHKGGICGDGCGLGKTHEIVSLLIGASEFWTKQCQKPCRPTLVLVPNNLLSKTKNELHDQLGEAWTVLSFGDKHRGAAVSFDGMHPIYNKAAESGKIVVVMSLEMLSTREPSAKLDGLYVRIVIDESQGIRRCDVNKRGKVLRALNAPFRWTFSGTVIHDNLFDLRGYLFFHERPGWAEKLDRNECGENSRIQRYKNFLSQLSEGGSKVSKEKPANFPYDWKSQCSSIEDLDEDEVQERVEENWLCSHFPALLRYNVDRAESIDRKPTKRGKKQAGSSADKGEPPYNDNPYNLWHHANYNKLRCCTLLAFDYWIGPHIQAKKDVSFHERLVERRVGQIFSTLVLSRNHYTQIKLEGGRLQPINSDLPPINHYTQDLRFARDELAAYQLREQECGKTFNIDWAKDPNVDIDKIFGDPKSRKFGSRFQQLSALSTHVGAFPLRDISTPEWRRRRNEGLPTLVARMKATRGLNPVDVTKALNTPEAVIRQFMWGTPKFRMLLVVIKRVLFGTSKAEGHRKLVVIFQWPRSAEMFLKLVEFIGIRAVLIDADMSQDKRLQEIDRFNDELEPRILIATYGVNIAGHDMQKRCCTLVLAEPGFNFPTEHQALCRVVRFGQTQPVEVIRLFVDSTYQEVQEHFMIQKGAPMMAAYGALARARKDTALQKPNLSSGELMKAALGLWRDRALDPLNVESAKRLALQSS